MFHFIRAITWIGLFLWIENPIFTLSTTSVETIKSKIFEIFCKHGK